MYSVCLAAPVGFCDSSVQSPNGKGTAFQCSSLWFSTLVLSRNLGGCACLLCIRTHQGTGIGTVGTATGTGRERTANAKEPITAALSVQYVAWNSNFNLQRPRKSQGQRAETVELAPYITRVWEFDLIPLAEELKFAKSYLELE